MKHNLAALFVFVAVATVVSQTFRSSSLNLEAHETGTGVATQTRWRDNYGGYDRDYRQRKKIIVTVRDLSRKAPPIVARVYFVARPLNGAQRFIYAQRELPINLNGQLEISADVGSPDLKSSVQSYPLLGAKYVAGADIDGWIVVGEVNGQTFQVRAANQNLLEIAQGNARQRDSFQEMIADYDKVAKRK
jgi:hypothetical protein